MLAELNCRDLKAENLLRDGNNQWVLCDFGSVTTSFVQYENANQIMMGEDVIRRYTTPSYRAPEVRQLQHGLLTLREAVASDQACHS